LCLECFGSGCSKCGGLPINYNLSGGEPLKTYIRSMGVLDQVFMDVSWLIRYQILPCEGGRYSQPALFLDAEQVVEAVKSGYDAIRKRMQRNG